MPASGRARRGPTWRAIIVPWLKPTSARRSSDRPARASSASMKASSTGAARRAPAARALWSRLDRPHHWKPPGAPGGFQWWGLSSLDHNARAAGARRAAPVLDAFIDAELARAGLSEDRLALVGFSQGTMMALHVGPRRARPLAGIVGYSGMLADEAELASEARTRPPILLVHGDADPMIPIAAFHQARKALGQAGFAVDSHVSPGLGHGIDPAGLQLGGRFLARVLSGPGHLPGAA